MNVAEQVPAVWRSRASWLLLAAVLPAGAVLRSPRMAQAADAPTATAKATATTTTTAQATAQASATSGAASPELEKMIGREVEATLKAFNTADANAVAALFMDSGELVDENGNVYTGKGEITGLFKAFFEKFPKAVLEMEVTSLRPLGDSLAVEEGVRRITAEDGAVAAQLRYEAVRDKVGDRWPIASYREFNDDPAPTPQDMLQPLSFLIGDWVDESPEGRTAINYRWSEDGNYILGDYVLSVGGDAESRSSQRIGWDPVEGTLRSWTFDSDGGFSQSEWTQIENGWVAKSEATIPDGTTASATVIVLVKDQDHFVVRSTDRIVAGSEEPDFELVIARKPPQPSGAAPAKPAPQQQ
jgi:uncharacterized protein (TIGR02246 family)